MRLKKKSGIIIRLVDVILIILFGFLMIAKIQQQVDIALPQSQGDNSTPDTDSKYYDVFVYRDGTIADGSNTLLAKMPLKDRETSRAQEEYEQLQRRIGFANKAKKIVVIRSQFDAPVQYTVDLLDICKKLDMPKSIRCLETIPDKPKSGG